MPRTFDFLIFRSPGKVVPGRATTVVRPARALGAPQTICRVSVADRDLAEGQPVGLGVRFGRDDQGGLQGRQLLIQRQYGIDLKSEHGQMIGQLLGCEAFGVNVVLQPVKRELHGSSRVISESSLKL